jgi:glycosyltransferase involved in cell wall biosynthesis
MSAAGVRRAAFRYIAEDGDTGYAIAADRLVRAIRDTGVEVEMCGWDSALRPAGLQQVAHSRDDRSRAAVAPTGAPTVMHLVPEHLPHVQHAVDGPVVVHTVWETDRLPAHWPGLLDRSNGVVVPTRWNRDTFLESGVHAAIDVVPHIACGPTIGDAGNSLGLGLPDDAVVFYTIGRWDERKAPALTVQAFLEAFTAADPVALVVKTTPFTDVRPLDDWGRGSPMYGTSSWEIARLLRDHPHPPRIELVVNQWDDRRIAALHTRGDCYVTLTHGEGWGLGSFDAGAYGNPVIATGWGGHLEYLEGSELLVDYDLVPVDHNAPASYGPEQSWADPRLDHAAELMRSVARDPAAARRAATPQRERVLCDYAGPVVAERFLAALVRFGVLGGSA